LRGSLAIWVPIVKTCSGSSTTCTGEGLVAFETNPHHRRAQLVVLTDKGKQTFDAAMRLQAPWINGLSEGLSVKDIQTVHRFIIALREKLERDEPEERA
jgi:DNA-binding MarR family transcriptional regulator